MTELHPRFPFDTGVLSPVPALIASCRRWVLRLSSATSVPNGSRSDLAGPRFQQRRERPVVAEGRAEVPHLTGNRCFGCSRWRHPPALIRRSAAATLKEHGCSARAARPFAARAPGARGLAPPWSRAPHLRNAPPRGAMSKTRAAVASCGAQRSETRYLGSMRAPVPKRRPASRLSRVFRECRLFRRTSRIWWDGRRYSG
jgi:hypothetical protein